ncbi:sugar phosphate isomerase/epimerase family protein [Candidatus Poribacteria bacterium]
MNVILSTGSLYTYSLSEVFDIAKSAGFDGMELLIARGNSSVGIDSIRELTDRYELPILSLHSPFMICDGWGDFWDRIQRSLMMAIELSIPLVNFHPPSGFVLRHHLNEELAEHIRIYKNMMDGSGIVLTIENLPTIRTFRRLFVNRFLLRTANNMYQIAEFARDNDIHVTFDTTHIGTSGVDLLEAYNVFRDRIENIHLSDYDGRWQHLLPGTGYLPLERLLSQVKADGYDGTITLETCPTAMEYEDKAKAKQNAEIGLRYIKDCLLGS